MSFALDKCFFSCDFFRLRTLRTVATNGIVMFRTVATNGIVMFRTVATNRFVLVKTCFLTSVPVAMVASSNKLLCWVPSKKALNK